MSDIRRTTGCDIISIIYYVYGLINKTSDRFFIGQTNNLKRRLHKHNKNNGHYTGKIVEQLELIYVERLRNRSVAIAREKQLKLHQGRDFLRAKINNPE